MNAAVCTLYEGHYNLGVGALINSLHKSGFEGCVYVGYKGDLPSWALNYPDVKYDASGRILDLSLGSTQIRFLPVKTHRYLTNYKPEFMLEVWENHATSCHQIFYFDPDIVTLAPWSFFSEWADLGLALVIDGNTPLPENSPLRHAWKQFCESMKFSVGSGHDYHFNGGFVGLGSGQKHVLKYWVNIQAEIEKVVRLDLPIGLAGAPEHQRNRIFPFYLTDQDVLNMVAQLNGVTLSPMGSEAMGWKMPAIYMLHACMQPKPWNTNYLRWALKGKAPNHIDDAFWGFMKYPIRLFTDSHISRMRRNMKIARLCAPICGWLQIMRG